MSRNVVEPTATEHWAGIAESGFILGIWLLYGVYFLTGRWFFRLVLVPVVTWYWLTKPLARSSSIEYLNNLQTRHGVVCERGHSPGGKEVFVHIMSFAETILDKLLAFSGRYRFDQVEVQNLDVVDQLARKGQGGLIITGHVGCLELCSTLANRVDDFKLTVLVHTVHAERFNAVLDRLSGKHKVEFIQVTEVSPTTAIDLLARVERGEFVAMAADRVPVTDSKVVTAQFLGKEACFPSGPHILASLLKCPVIFMGCIRKRNAHRIVFHYHSDQVVLPRKQRQEAIARHAEAFAAFLENLIIQSPYDWFNFYPFWSPVKSIEHK